MNEETENDQSSSSPPDPSSQYREELARLKNEADQHNNQFYPPEHREKWKRALHMAYESRQKGEKGQDHRALCGESVDEFEWFRNDLEALEGEVLDAVVFPEPVIQNGNGKGFPQPYLLSDHSGNEIEGIRKYFLPRSQPLDEAIADLDSEEPLLPFQVNVIAHPLQAITEWQGEFVLGELLHRFRSNDVKFFRAFLNYVEKRAAGEPKKTLAGHLAPIANELGKQLGRNPNYEEVLKAVREAGIPFEKTNESAMFNNYGLSFLPKCKPGPKRKRKTDPKR